MKKKISRGFGEKVGDVPGRGREDFPMEEKLGVMKW
jgi:hypothetical protein